MTEPFLAEIRMTAFNFAPKGWALCNGQLLPINQNQALFALLGTQYGGNGQTTFALPDLRARAAVHPGSEITLGQNGGEESHTLTIAEMPNHTHLSNTDSNPASTSNPSGAVPAAQDSAPYGSSTADTNLSGSTIGVSGGSQPHNNLQPYLVVNFIIALQGIFPSRN